MSWDRRGGLALLRCLAVAGGVAALTLTKLPSARAVWPDPPESPAPRRWTPRCSTSVRRTRCAAGRASTTTRPRRSSSSASPHRDMALLEPWLHTAGGLTYWPVSRGDITSTISVPVGQRVIAAVVFEVPPELLAGATTP